MLYICFIKEFICWYAYVGMETEGRLDMYQPMVYKAVDVAEAMWMYRDWLNKTKQDDVTGWGWNYRELK